MTPADRICELAAQAGRRELCSEECPLWEHGECSLDLLTPDGELEAEDEPLEVT